MRVNDNGYIGIGTYAPDELFEVEGGNMRITNSNTFIDIYESDPSSASGLRAYREGVFEGAIFFDPGYMNITKSWFESGLVVDFDSNFVGIGTDTPDDPLYVEHYVSTHSSSLSPTITAYVSSSTDTMIGILAGQNGYQGVYGYTTRDWGYGVYGVANGEPAYGVRGKASGSGANYAIYGQASGGSTNWAGYFAGNVNITGTLSKGAGSFLIDHPLDPLHKTLRHNFVESPENLCIYRGKVKLDATGQAKVRMPDYFAALTREDEATVVLTPIGRTPFLASYEWNDDFTAFTVYGEPQRYVSYQVLADRDDPVIHKLYRPVVEVKGENNGWIPGKLLYPEAYGYPPEMGQDYSNINN